MHHATTICVQSCAQIPFYAYIRILRERNKTRAASGRDSIPEVSACQECARLARFFDGSTLTWGMGRSGRVIVCAVRCSVVHFVPWSSAGRELLLRCRSREWVCVTDGLYGMRTDHEMPPRQPL